ncbi:MAG: PAS domain-containing protein [Sphingosinicella sp.]|nr:PAS domain-containing protein [Sphingosinicella sp.]
MRKSDARQAVAEAEVEGFRKDLGPFVVAAETTRMAMVFTNAKEHDTPIIFANDSFLKLTGYSREEVLGQSFGFLGANAKDVDAFASIRAGLDNPSGQTMEIECRRKNGQEFLAAIYISPVRDDRDQIVQHFASFVDLTAHSKRLQKERDALHALYQRAPGFIATTDGPEHCITFVNASYKQLVGDRDVVGKTVAEALPEIVDQDFVGLLDTVYSTGQPYIGEGIPIRLQRTAGSPPDLRYIDFIYHPVRDAEDQITGLFCEGHDVTEQKRAMDEVLTLQSELVHLSRVSAMGTMATTLAHELNQPLAAISNYMAGCRRILDPTASNATALDHGLKAIGESSARAGAIISRLRDMTKRGKTQHEVFDLKDAVSESVALIRIGACEGVRIQDESKSGVDVDADRVQIQQVIMNLARNGCEAVQPQKTGHVSVSTIVKGNRVIVSVKDDGPGVVSDVARSLFDGLETTKPEGMGIGLSICRTIVEAHGGNIWLEKSDSHGSNFCFSLPIADRRPG